MSRYGLLGMALGACTNEYSPADGRVVDAEYGCGAHSETVIDAPLISASTDTVVDEFTLEVHARPATSGPPDEESTVPPGAAQGAAEEPLAEDLELLAVPDVDWAPLPDLESSATLDPVPDAEPDLLQDKVIDPVVVLLVDGEVLSGSELTTDQGDDSADPDVAADRPDPTP